jgi:hypothetical protein
LRSRVLSGQQSGEEAEREGWCHKATKLREAAVLRKCRDAAPTGARPKHFHWGRHPAS